MFILLILLSLLIPIAGFGGAIAFFYQYKKPIPAALLIGVASSAALYGYVSDSGNDIYRHIEHLALYQNVSFTECFNLLVGERISNVFTWDVWSWLIAQLDDPYLLQSSGALLGYTILAYFVFDVAALREMRFSQCFFFLIMSMTCISPLGIAIGIRNAAAFLLCALSFYEYYTKGKSKSFVLSILIIAFFIHHTVSLILLCWLFVPFFARHKYATTTIICALSLLFSNYAQYVDALSNSSNFLVSIILSPLSSAATYQEMEFNTSVHAIVSLIWSIVTIAILLFFTKKCISNKNDYLSKYWDLAFLIFIISICLVCLIGNNGSRYLSMVSVLCLMIFLLSSAIVQRFKIIGNFQRMFLTGIITGNCLLNLYNMAWGDASFISFFQSCLLGYATRLF